MPSDDEDSYTTDYSVGDISLFSECEEGNDTQEMEEVEEVETDNFDGEGENEEEDAYSHEQEPSSVTTETHKPMVLEPTTVVYSSLPTHNFGYVLVIDNIDMNVRRSFQRCDCTTKSYHFCHAFAVENRLDTSVLSDGAPTGMLSSEALLPSSNDLQRLTEDFTVLVSRFVEKEVCYIY